MRCLAVMVDIDHRGIDSVILWERDGQAVAIAYLDGKVTMTRPLEATTFDECVSEFSEAFAIRHGRVARIQEWVQVR